MASYSSKYLANKRGGEDESRSTQSKSTERRVKPSKMGGRIQVRKDQRNTTNPSLV